MSVCLCVYYTALQSCLIYPDLTNEREIMISVNMGVTFLSIMSMVDNIFFTLSVGDSRGMWIPARTMLSCEKKHKQTY